MTDMQHAYNRQVMDIIITCNAHVRIYVHVQCTLDYPDLDYPDLDYPDLDYSDLDYPAPRLPDLKPDQKGAGYLQKWACLYVEVTANPWLLRSLQE